MIGERLIEKGVSDMKKKVLALFMAFILCVPMTACSKKDDKIPSPTAAGTGVSEPESTAPEGEGTTAAVTEGGEGGNGGTGGVPNTGVTNQIIIGDTTDTTGDIRQFWSNTGIDATVNRLVSGYSTVTFDQDAVYLVDQTAVKNYSFTENEDGSKTFDVTLQDNLYWSNGERITAKDYVGAVLLFASPLLMEMGINSTLGDYFKGFSDYNSGKSEVFTGVRLLAEDRFSVTLSEEYLPHFFELSYVAVTPEYMKGWLPEDVTVQDDGKGAYFSDNFTTEHCAKTIENWRWNMNVFSGPYVRTAYDEGGRTYTLKINDKYAGNFEGRRPSIQTIIVKTVQQNTMLDDLRTGGVDLLVQVPDGAQITQGLDMMDRGEMQGVSYDRNGYGYLAFKCDIGPTQFKEVRHAIAYLFDRNEFAKTFTAGFGSVVNGPYGSGMWMAEEGEEELSDLNAYVYSYEDALEELTEGGWIYSADGSEYSGSGLRYKKLDDGTLMPLRIYWASSEKNSVSDLIVTMLAKNPDVARIGMEINQVVMTYDEMYTEHFQNPDETYYGMFNLATNFTPTYDMKNSYTIGHPYNTLKTDSKELEDLAVAMLRVDPEDKEKFLSIWLEFVEEWNEYLPALPLYSNRYYDFFSNKLENYTDLTGYWNASYAILYANVTGYGAEK